MSSRPPVEVYLAELRGIVDEAEATDYIMPLWLPYLGAILMVFGTLGLVAAAASGSEEALAASVVMLSLLSFVGLLVELYAVYKWIDRRNKHFTRVHKLYTTIISLAESIAPGEPELARMKSLAEEARDREREKSPGLWLILMIFLGFIAWAYVMHFLSRDFAEHESRERRFFLALSDMLKRRGAALTVPERAVPERNTLLYAVLTVVTLGLFGLYWVYTVTNDPNKHFQQHRLFEQKLLQALSQLAR